MATMTKSTGKNSYVGWALEDQANPGVPVAATNYLPTIPDQTNIHFDPKRTVMEEASGTAFIDGDAVDLNGTATGDVHFYLRSTWGMDLLFAAAFADSGGAPHVGTITRPRFLTLEIMRGGQSWQHAGCMASVIKLTAAQGAMPTVTITFMGLKKPVLIEPSAPSGIASLLAPSNDPGLGWRDFGSATLLAGGAGATSLDQFNLNIALGTLEFPGNGGDGMPTDMIEGAAQVSGDFNRLFKDIAQWQALVDAIKGPLSFGWTRSPDSIRFDMPNGIYLTDAPSTPLKQANQEKLTFHSLAPGGANPLTLTVQNGHPTPYS